MGSDECFPWTWDRKLSILRRSTGGSAMRKIASLAAPLLGVLILGAQTVPSPTKTAAEPPKDNYIWLEDVHGQKQLDWVKEQNRVSLGPLKADPRYAANYKSILEVLDAADRIPYGSLRK